MNSTVRSNVLLAGVVALACVVGVAQSSREAIYKQKCLNCHGPDGVANSGIGKVMRVKPVNNTGVKKLSEAKMIQFTHDGMGKMQPYKDELTSAQIKASVDYFRTFIK